MSSRPSFPRRRSAVALLVCAASLVPVAGRAQTVDGSDTEQLVNLMRGFGSATLGETDDGAPRITGRMDGNGYAVFFYGCDDGNANCKSLNFYASWEKKGVALDRINGWNATKRFSRAYLDDAGDPVVEMDVNLYRGVTTQNFEDTLDWWKTVMQNFRTDLVEKE